MVLQPGERVYLRNFTREDGLDPVYQGPYSVIDFKYPNVKIEREGGRASWIHVDNCKIVPRGLAEHLVQRDSTPETHEEVYQPEITVSGQDHIEETTKEREKGEEQPVRRSTRDRRKPKRYELD